MAYQRLSSFFTPKNEPTTLPRRIGQRVEVPTQEEDLERSVLGSSPLSYRQRVQAPTQSKISSQPVSRPKQSLSPYEKNRFLKQSPVWQRLDLPRQSLQKYSQFPPPSKSLREKQLQMPYLSPLPPPPINRGSYLPRRISQPVQVPTQEEEDLERSVLGSSPLSYRQPVQLPTQEEEEEDLERSVLGSSPLSYRQPVQVPIQEEEDLERSVLGSSPLSYRQPVQVPTQEEEDLERSVLGSSPLSYPTQSKISRQPVSRPKQSLSPYEKSQLVRQSPVWQRLDLPRQSLQKYSRFPPPSKSLREKQLQMPYVSPLPPPPINRGSYLPPPSEELIQRQARLSRTPYLTSRPPRSPSIPPIKYYPPPTRPLPLNPIQRFERVRPSEYPSEVWNYNPAWTERI